MKYLAFGFWFMLGLMPALADITIIPGGRTSNNCGGTITSGGSFQSALPASNNRTGCLIQNTSTHTLFVFLGATASATTSNSVQVGANGGTFNCDTYGGQVAQDNVAVSTSTTSDPFVCFEQR